MAHVVATVQQPYAPRELPGLEYDKLLACVHCGLCLPTCPTYSELGTEMDSPRGRIYLLKALADGRIALTDSVVKHLHLCLDCRACESACPSGVRYGELIEAAKTEIVQTRPQSAVKRLVRKLSFDYLLPSPAALRAMAASVRLYQRLGLQTLVRATGVLRLVPGPLEAWEALLPPLPLASARGPLPEVMPAQGERKERVGFLHGCIQDVVFRPHNTATLWSLVRNGCEVVTPRDQRCCGALHAHAGERGRAAELARHNIAVFERAGVESIIVNAAGCGAHMKGYGHLLADDPAWAERAEAFGAKVKDITEQLAKRPLEGPLGPVPMKVTYHDPCHLCHGQKVRTQPRQLLKSIPGLEVAELKESEFCCGSAGIYNLTEPEMARKLLERKVTHIVATGAQAVVTANTGCILQIALGLRRRKVGMGVMHVVELIDRAYQAGGARR